MTPENLLPQVYHELRKLAQAKLACENPGRTLNATALVHEAFLKLGGEQSFASKRDYLKAAATVIPRRFACYRRPNVAVCSGLATSGIETIIVAKCQMSMPTMKIAPNRCQDSCTLI